MRDKEKQRIKLPFESYEKSLGSGLLPLFRGSNYTHHEKIKFLDHRKNGGKNFHVTINNDSAKTDTNLVGDPSVI